MKKCILFGLLVLACFVFLAAGDAQAGPIRNAIANAQANAEARRAARCSCSARPPTLQPGTGVHAAKPTTLIVPTASDPCPGGRCPTTAVSRRSIFGL